MQATLYLIPVTLGSTPIEQVIPSYNKEIILTLRHFIVENIRSARRFLRQVDKTFPIDDSTFYEMGKHADEGRFSQYLQVLSQGQSMGIISEAGCPAVADPGAVVVRLAHKKNYPVVPLVGPNSMIMAVMASGLDGQSFAFNGYLPIDPSERAKLLKKLENRARSEHQTQLFIETPFRNHKMFDALLSTLRADTRLCIAAGITTLQEYIHTHTIQDWKKQKLPNLNDVPAIFLIG